MRSGILAFAPICLALATGAAAGPRFGAEVGFPLPGRGVADSQRGMDAGVTLTDMQSPHLGIGFDLAFHYWPASPGYKAAFDRYLSRTRHQVIDGSTWAFSALQFTVHMKLVAPEFQGIGSWVQVGAGLYRLDRNLAAPDWESSPVIVRGRLPSDVTPVLGWHGSIGLDLDTSARMAVGFHGSYHNVGSEHRDVPRFTAFTIGTHVRFGR